MWKVGPESESLTMPPWTRTGLSTPPLSGTFVFCRQPRSTSAEGRWLSKGMQSEASETPKLSAKRIGKMPLFQKGEESCAAKLRGACLLRKLATTDFKQRALCKLPPIDNWGPEKGVFLCLPLTDALTTCVNPYDVSRFWVNKPSTTAAPRPQLPH